MNISFVEEEDINSKTSDLLRKKREVKIPLRENIGSDIQRKTAKMYRFAKMGNKLNESESKELDLFMSEGKYKKRNDLIKEYAKEKTFAPMKKMLTKSEVVISFQIDGEDVLHLSNNHLFMKLKLLNIFEKELSAADMTETADFFENLIIDKVEYLFKAEQSNAIRQTFISNPDMNSYVSQIPTKISNQKLIGSFAEAGKTYSYYVANAEGVMNVTDDFISDMGIGDINLGFKPNMSYIVINNEGTTIGDFIEGMGYFVKDSKQNKWGYSVEGKYIIERNKTNKLTYLKFKPVGFVQTEYWLTRPVKASVIYTCSIPVDVFLKYSSKETPLAKLEYITNQLININTVSYLKAAQGFGLLSLDLSNYKFELSVLKSVELLVTLIFAMNWTFTLTYEIQFIRII